ncbi:MAG TPA: hypothetical protein VHE30_09805 [Polyangiaceae bacterium]|nr:hypothetical protein [Polyangiaceae bacterium]
MNRRTFLELCALFPALAVATRSSGASAGTKLAVIVNAANDVGRLGPGDIEAFFTTRKLDFPSGKRVVAFNFPARHPIRDAFDRAALHLDPDEAARYWIDRRVRGGHPPPRQVPDVKTMVRVVASLEGALGYVRKEDVTDGVRVVAEI